MSIHAAEYSLLLRYIILLKRKNQNIFVLINKKSNKYTKSYNKQKSQIWSLPTPQKFLPNWSIDCTEEPTVRWVNTIFPLIALMSELQARALRNTISKVAYLILSKYLYIFSGVFSPPNIQAGALPVFLNLCTVKGHCLWLEARDCFTGQTDGEE